MKSVVGATHGRETSRLLYWTCSRRRHLPVSITVPATLLSGTCPAANQGTSNPRRLRQPCGRCIQLTTRCTRRPGRLLRRPAVQPVCSAVERIPRATDLFSNSTMSWWLGTKSETSPIHSLLSSTLLEPCPVFNTSLDTYTCSGERKNPIQ